MSTRDLTGPHYQLRVSRNYGDLHKTPWSWASLDMLAETITDERVLRVQPPGGIGPGPQDGPGVWAIEVVTQTVTGRRRRIQAWAERRDT